MAVSAKGGSRIEGDALVHGELEQCDFVTFAVGLDDDGEPAFGLVNTKPGKAPSQCADEVTGAAFVVAPRAIETSLEVVVGEKLRERPSD